MTKQEAIEVNKALDKVYDHVEGLFHQACEVRDSAQKTVTDINEFMRTFAHMKIANYKSAGVEI